LVPPNAISKIIEQWQQLQELEAYQPLYSRFVLFFKHLDKGHHYKTYDLPAYNGGLFAPDEILDNISIDDEILKDDALLLSSYDYSTEVDVNILGHIFEHSLNEIEEITAEIEGTTTDKNQTKRKKDGVFYTPKYITQYIVENTIGKLCAEKRKELCILEIEFDESIKTKNGKISAKGKKLFDTLQAYKDWLFSLKIVDPACGSGAFLNQALSFLINEHQQIDDIIAELTGEKLRLFDTDKTILEKNLYGVDINDESVEIAKLSLWLRTAQKGRKLSNLNNNIKCGNSLIDDPEIAGEKAFNWQNEFAEIFANGGFDVVIGNPPYVNINTLPEIHGYLKESYSEIHTGYNDLMYYFLYKGISILNQNGTFGVITSNYFIGNEYSQKLRGYLTKYLNTLVNFNEYLIFEDANVHTTIILADKAVKNDEVVYYSYINDNNKLTFIENKQFKEMSETRKKLGIFWIFSEKNKSKILDKLFKVETRLGDISIIEKGSTSGKNEVFTISNEEANQLNLEKEILRLNVKNGDIHRYSIFNRKNYLIYTDNNTKIEEYPNIFKYLEQSKEILGNRNEVRKGSYQWWRMERPRKKEFFDSSEKIIVPYRATSNRFAYDNEQRFNDGGDIRVIVISNTDYSTKYVLSLLNSKLLDWFYGFIGKPKGKSREYFNEPLAKIPILNCDNQQPFIEKVDLMLSLNKELQEKAIRFINRVKANFEIEKISNKLEKYYDFDYRTFVAELKKQKIKLSLVQQDEWEEYFNAYKTEINNLQSQISATENEIDKMVYELYGLTNKEIAIVEDSMK
jgi:type I restriction-modification system DNA methylase subunit